MLYLYTTSQCPYCDRVKTYLHTVGIPFTEKNIETNPAYRTELVTLGGKLQIPFLVDTDARTHLYESSEIIEYVATHYANHRHA